MNKKYFVVVIAVSVFALVGCMEGDVDQTGDVEVVNQDQVVGENCEFLLSGGVTPLKDMQVFTDSNYNEVTLTARDAWDLDKLPVDVIEYENEGYTCYPMPFEFGEMSEEGGVYAEPEVKSVEWSCELEYEDNRYLEKEVELPQGYVCEDETCLDGNGEVQSIKFCWK